MSIRLWLISMYRTLKNSRTRSHQMMLSSNYSALPAIVVRLEPRSLMTTYQDFDSTGSGTPFNNLQVENAPGPVEIQGGPTVIGKFLRLVDDSSVPNVNTITFQTSDVGPYNQVIADFDFRITPGNGRADGFSFALLNTAMFPSNTNPNVAPQSPLFAAEEPNYAGSIGIGFDIFKNDHQPGVDDDDIGSDDIRPNFSNSISVHFNANLLFQVDVTPTLDLASGRWNHARIVMRPGGGFSDISVVLTPEGGEAVTVLSSFEVPGFVPYEGRVHYAARAGGQSAKFDIDNINANFFNDTPVTLSFDKVSQVVHESQAFSQITVTRTGDVGPVSVQYLTTNGTAVAGSDYVGIPPTTFSFNTGEMSKTFNVPIINDISTEGDETFLVSLRNPVGATLSGVSKMGVTIFDDETSKVRGNWDNPMSMPVVAIHSSVLPTGEVFFWDRFGQVRKYDPATNEFSTPDQPKDREGQPYNLFCSGHAFLPDGKLLVTGGHHRDGSPTDDFHGLDDVSVYDSIENVWTPMQKMNAGRWYPTNTTLPNGDMLVLSGTVAPGVVRFRV